MSSKDPVMTTMMVIRAIYVLVLCRTGSVRNFFRVGSPSKLIDSFLCRDILVSLLGGVPGVTLELLTRPDTTEIFFSFSFSLGLSTSFLSKVGSPKSISTLTSP